jgi:hypothetical protein
MSGETIVTLLVVLVIFLVGREILCWYWKQNEQVRLMNEILEQLKAIRDPDYVPKKQEFKGMLRR